jgi:hypothetical protein
MSYTLYHIEKEKQEQKKMRDPSSGAMLHEKAR